MRTFLIKAWWLINVLLDALIIFLLVYPALNPYATTKMLLHMILAVCVALVMPRIWKWFVKDVKRLFKRKKQSGAGAY